MANTDAYNEMIDYCLEHDNLLSAWEGDFILSIKDRLDSGYELTAGQAEALAEVYGRTKEAAGWSTH